MLRKLLIWMLIIALISPPGIATGEDLSKKDLPGDFQSFNFKNSKSVDNGQYATNELLIKFKPEAARNLSAKNSAHSKTGAVVKKAYKGISGLQLVELPKNAKLSEALNKYKSNPDIEYAEPNYVVSINSTPNDPAFGQLWGLNNTGQLIENYAGLNNADIDAPEAWEVETGSSNEVTIAVIDSGVDYMHPDLVNNMWRSPEGYYGWDFVNNDNNPMDDNGHGTHVAGTIAAEGNNGIGTTGVMHQAKIMALKVLGANGKGYTSDIIDSILYANTHQVDVINMSLGGGDYSQALYDAIAASNAVVVVAAGNESNDNDISPSYPASYNLPNIISVAATNNKDTLATFSNYGETSVDVAAPGVSIYSTLPPMGDYSTSTTLFSDSINDLTNWSTTDYIYQPWGLSANPYTSAPTSAGDSPGGNYSSNEETWLDLAIPIDLSNYSYSKAVFNLWLETEDYYDGLGLIAFVGGQTIMLDSWTGSTGGQFYSVEADLSPLAGQTNIFLSFVLIADDTINYRGAYIDDFKILATNSSKIGYDYMDGTSMAAPHVAGLAGLIKAKNPALTNLEIKYLILNNVDLLATLSGKVVTGGRINALSTLKAIPSVTTVEVTGPASVTIPGSEAYTAIVKDQYGEIMAGEGVSWGLKASATGVTIDPATGVLAVGNDASVGTVTVVATSTSNANMSAELVVSIEKAPSAVTNIEITGAASLIIPGIETYTATVKNQYGDIMTGEPVSWSLKAPVTGVSIDPATGVLTVGNDATVGTVTVVATSTTDTNVSGELAVSIEKAASVVTTVEVTGLASVTIPGSETYTAVVKNQYGDIMTGEPVSWSLKAPATDVSIDPATGLLTVGSDAGVGTVTVVATSATDTNVAGELVISIEKAASIVTNLEVTGPNSITIPSNITLPNSETYSAVVKDQYGDIMTGEEVTWSLKVPATGVSIDPITGELTVESFASVGTVVVIATSTSNLAVSTEKLVSIEKAASLVTAVEVTGPGSVTIPVSEIGSETYSAVVKDQYGETMASEGVTWSLKSPVTGVIIDSTTGILTVGSDASVGTVTVVATSITNGTVSAEKLVSIERAAAEVTSIEVTGPISVTIPGSETYSAVVKDQYGETMASEGVTWSLKASATGVTIDPATGILTVDINASVGTVTVVATSGTVSGELAVNVVKAASVVTTVEVTGPGSVTIPGTETYTAVVKNQYGDTMTGETVNWSLKAPATGVSIDPATGILTVDNSSSVGTITVVATSTTDINVSRELAVSIVKAASVVTTVEVTGPGSVTIPGNETYTAVVKNQYGDTMTGETVSWSLKASATGVIIDPATGILTVDSNASVGTVTVVATSGTVSAEQQVSIEKATSAVTTIEVTGPSSVTIPVSETGSETYSAVVKDQYGEIMTTEGVSWSIKAPATGVSIESQTGILTVGSNASVGTVTVVATSATNAAVSVEKQVSIEKATSIVTNLEVTGPNSITIPSNITLPNSETYSAVVKNQYGDIMTGEEVTWSLKVPATGVSIDPITGELTVESFASVGTVVVIATSTSNLAVSTEKQVSIEKAVSVVTAVEVTGPTSVTIPVSETGSETYSAVVKDQYGEIMTTEGVTWSLKSPVTGVSINPATGILTVDSNASVGTITVVVTSQSNANVFKETAVSIVKAVSVVTTVEVTGPSSVTIPGTETYTAVVKNQYGDTMTGETVSWSLKAPATGVAIDPATGVLTVGSDASVGTITVVATSTTNTSVGTETQVSISLPPSDGGGGGGYISPIPAPTNSPVIEIGEEGLIVEVGVDSSGKTKEIVVVKAEILEVIQNAKQQGKSSVEININNNESSIVQLTIPKDIIKASEGLGIKVSSLNASVEVPSNVVNSYVQQGKDLIMTFSKGNTNLVVENVKNVKEASGAQVIGTPTVIKTDIIGTTKVRIPLTGLALPTDSVGKEFFLNSLSVFVVHSDGESELIKGEISLNDIGQPIGFSFNVEKFSTFALIKLNKLKDIPGHWAEDNIKRLFNLGIVKGTSDGTFKPSSSVTRAEFTALIVRALGLTLDTSVNSELKDIDNSKWYYGAVNTAYKTGIITGYPDKTFRPNQAITRQEMAVIIGKAVKIADNRFNMSQEEAAQKLSLFKDKSNISNFAVESVAMAVKNGIIVGTPEGTFMPNNEANRAEAAVVIFRAMLAMGLIN